MKGFVMKMEKHSWLMMAGCGVMLVGVFILPMLGIRLGGVPRVLFALACPLSMIFMMGSMGGGHDHSGRSRSNGENDHQGHCSLPASSDKEP
jgi:hypothetical protein